MSKFFINLDVSQEDEHKLYQYCDCFRKVCNTDCKDIQAGLGGDKEYRGYTEEYSYIIENAKSFARWRCMSYSDKDINELKKAVLHLDYGVVLTEQGIRIGRLDIPCEHPLGLFSAEKVKIYKDYSDGWVLTFKTYESLHQPLGVVFTEDYKVILSSGRQIYINRDNLDRVVDEILASRPSILGVLDLSVLIKRIHPNIQYIYDKLFEVALDNGIWAKDYNIDIKQHLSVCPYCNLEGGHIESEGYYSCPNCGYKARLCNILVKTIKSKCENDLEAEKHLGGTY